MTNESNGWLQKVWFPFVGLLSGVAILMIGITLWPALNSSLNTRDTYSEATVHADIYDSSNVVTNGMASVLSAASRTSEGIAQSFGDIDLRNPIHIGSPKNAATSVASTTGRTATLIGTTTVHGAGFALKSIGERALFVPRVALKVLAFEMSIPAKMARFVSGSHVVANTIKPADHSPVPVIDPKSPELAVATAALPAVTQANQPDTVASALEPLWPMHGTVTTEFGTPGWPYQTVHTGIDITDGWRVGVTPVHAFRRGTVLTTLTNGGLGKHVIVDHGNGVTSVYGHLHTISVTAGQVVNTNTALGYVGSTGVSTGPHLHFEIRVNGQATNPRQFIPGQP